MFCPIPSSFIAPIAVVELISCYCQVVVIETKMAGSMHIVISASHNNDISIYSSLLECIYSPAVADR